jgi:chaperone required for assembly of F1-ATPase
MSNSSQFLEDAFTVFSILTIDLTRNIIRHMRATFSSHLIPLHLIALRVMKSIMKSLIMQFPLTSWSSLLGSIFSSALYSETP